MRADHHLRSAATTWLALLSTLFAGCVHTPLTQRLPEASSIVVLNPARPAQLELSTAFDAKRFIPAYGMARDIYAGTVLTDIQEELQARNFDAAILLQQELLSNLEAAGHMGQPHTIPRERARAQHRGPRNDPQPRRRPAGVYPEILALTELPTVDGQHLFLDSKLLVYGFWAGIDGDFTPKLLVHARATNTDTQKILMDRLFAYNLSEPGAVQLAGDETERWTDLEEMQRDVPALERALTRGVSAVAAAIVDALRTAGPADRKD